MIAFGNCCNFNHPHRGSLDRRDRFPPRRLWLGSCRFGLAVAGCKRLGLILTLALRHKKILFFSSLFILEVKQSILVPRGFKVGGRRPSDFFQLPTELQFLFRLYMLKVRGYKRKKVPFYEPGDRNFGTLKFQLCLAGIALKATAFHWLRPFSQK